MKAYRKTFGIVWVFALAAGFVLCCCGPVLATTYYVKAGATGDGSSWASAYGELQDALDERPSYGDQIWVAEGTYYPTSDYRLGIGDRGKHFRMINGVGIYGGFDNASDPGWNDRNPNMYETILSGDIGVGGNDSDNCYHVFYHPVGTDLDPNAILDGLTITSANADGPYPHDYGGGMYNQSNSPTVTGCTFSGNYAAWDGGGMLNSFESSPTVSNCTFTGNSAGSGGGGIENWSDSSPTVTNCTFSYNSASYGGGMYNWQSSPTVTNCTFGGNSAGGDGGGMYNNIDSSPTLTNCILWGNTDSGPTDESAQIINIVITPVIDYTCVQGWTGAMGGEGNIDTNPLFVDPDGADNIAGNADDDLRLQPCSPCIDAGDNDSVPAGVTTDLDGGRRFVDDPVTQDSGNGTPPVVDMGAYEYHPICVDETATGSNDGSNWEDAYNYLQDALATVEYGDTIWVAEGTYRPDEDTANPTGTDVRTDTFALISGVALYGGFPTGGSDFADRNPNQYATILSGDLFVNDGRGFGNNDENSYHVVSASGVDPNAILDGFTISGGNANGEDIDVFGGGMFNDLSSTTVIRCNFIGNSAYDSGGGMFNNGESPTVINCSFIGNSANAGGGMFNKYSDPAIINCVLNGNVAADDGGGMFNNGREPAIVNCTFSGNLANDGGGMYNRSSSPTVTNCILWDNSASTGPEIFNISSTPTVTYSDVAGGYGGTGNINVAPMFKDADGPDDVVGTADDNLQLAYDSPCIDAADSNSVPPDYADLDEDGDTAERTPLDLAYNDRFTDDQVVPDTGTGTPPIVDMGAYERYEFCGSEPYPYRPGDANQDCRFDLADIAIIALQWLDYYGPM